MEHFRIFVVISGTGRYGRKIAV